MYRDFIPYMQCALFQICLYSSFEWCLASPYLYGASALATAASSGSHLSPLLNNFSLL